MPEVENRPGLRILLDQNVPLPVAEWPRGRQPHWEVFHVLDVGLRGSADRDVFQWAQDDRCLIVTFDRDFGDLRSFAAGQHYGIIHLRVRPTTVEQIRSAFGRLFEQMEDVDLEGALVIFGRDTIRVRRGGTPQA